MIKGRKDGSDYSDFEYDSESDRGLGDFDDECVDTLNDDTANPLNRMILNRRL